MIGNKEKAKYFFEYLMTQLQEADENNPIVAEYMISVSPSCPTEAKLKWTWPCLSNSYYALLNPYKTPDISVTDNTPYES